MKQLACILLFIFQVSFSGFAQDNPNIAIKDKIRDIKLAEDFIFAESTSSATYDEALKSAEDILHTHIINWMTSIGKDKQTAENTWNTAKGSLTVLRYQNISLHKVFVYIPKNSINSSSTLTLTGEAIAQVNNQPPETIAAPSPTVTATPATELPPINLDDFDISEEDLEKPLNQDVNALLALDTYQSVIFYLDAMQDDGRLVYGRIATLTAPEQAYLIIVKDSKLVTILDKGKGERMNLKTKQMETASKYRGHAIIWMKTFK